MDVALLGVARLCRLRPLRGAGRHALSTGTFANQNNAKERKDSDTSLAYVSYENATQKNTQCPLVIQHPLFGRKENHSNIGRLISHLTKRTVFIPDARNHGNSPKCENPSIHQMSTDLLAFQNQLKINRSCLLGFNTGGRVAMMTALQQPQSVERMVVTATTPLNTQKLLTRWEKSMEAAHIIYTLSKANGYTSFSDCIEMDFELKLKMDEALKSTIKEDKERALFLNNLGKTNLRALMNNPDMGRFPDLDGNVFSGPVMFISGEKKPAWSSDEDIRMIRKLFPNSHFVKIPGAGHWVHNEKGDDFLSAVITFLQTEF